VKQGWRLVLRKSRGVASPVREMRSEMESSEELVISHRCERTAPTPVGGAAVRVLRRDCAIARLAALIAVPSRRHLSMAR
jgi:hypothetical protein